MTDIVMCHDSFELLDSQRVNSLNLDVQQFRHRATGAMHYHLAAENDENVFLVALRTVPQDSSGVAHILEHTVLCGSERFPVRDPFFLMLRRSLNTFMNAFTSSDWTAYPFASQNRKDFNNLLQVYLDAVFFSRLDPLDFSQEGHRVEFEEPANPDSKLVFKGVVFNEMKGAMSSVTDTLWQTLCHHLFPSTSYHYNSGGEPDCIPDLSYDQLQHFYRGHYHPGNAIFMTFGDIPPAAHQQAFEELALSRFERLETKIAVPLEQRFAAPQRATEYYALDDSGGSDRKTHIVMAWLLGESTDLEQQLEAHLLAGVLLDNSASPLQQALETTALGQAPSPLCGLETSMREMVFVCGIEGSEAACAPGLETLVLDVLEKVRTDGVDTGQLEAALQQLELEQREISGDSLPYGLQLIIRTLAYATHYADPGAALNLDPVLNTLRERIGNPDYIGGLVRRLLLDNPHRITLILRPDRSLSDKKQAREAARLAAMKAGFSERDIARVLHQTRALTERQTRPDDASILPRVSLADVPARLPEPTAQDPAAGAFPCTRYQQGTNGLVYQQVLMPMPALATADLERLPYYSNALTELGLGAADYLRVQERQAATCGSINAFATMRGDIADVQRINAWFVLSSKALLRNQRGQSQLMRDTLETVRFDEHNRIRELVAQQRARREQAVTGNGHGLAMTAACAGMSPLAAINHRLAGLQGIRACKQLDDSLNKPAALATFAAGLAELHRQINAMPRQFLTIAEAGQLPAISADCEAIWSPVPARDGRDYQARPITETRRELWLANTRVNFCAQAFPTVAIAHEDAAALTVLGNFLRNGYLHTALREQGGAYGGGAAQDSDTGAFRMFSYRDPRLEGTLADFNQAITWMLSSEHDDDALEQAILGVIGGLDKPGSPAGEARRHFHGRLCGRDHALRQRFRQRVLALTIADLRRVTATYLRPDVASIAVITSHSGLQAAAAVVDRLSLQVEEL